MGRIYTAAFQDLSLNAAADIITLVGSSACSYWEVHEIVLVQRTQTAVELLPVSWVRYRGSYTAGSGGTSLTLAKNLPGDANATVTATTNNSSRTVVNTGTKDQFDQDCINVINGLQLLPPPDDRWEFGPSQSAVLTLDAAPAAGPYKFSGKVRIAEYF